MSASFDNETVISTVPAPDLATSFWRAQVSSLIASAVDFGTLILGVEVLRIWYVAATALGAFCGAVTNFLLGRHWSFEARDHGYIHHQAVKYAMVSGTSLCLNSGGVWLLTETTHMRYWLSRLIIGFFIGITFNFWMHRHFVFRKGRHGKSKTGYSH